MFLVLLTYLTALQGNDYGTQYRSGIYYHNNQQRDAALAYIREAQKNYSQPIVTEVSVARRAATAGNDAAELRRALNAVISHVARRILFLAAGGAGTKILPRGGLPPALL